MCVTQVTGSNFDGFYSLSSFIFHTFRQILLEWSNNGSPNSGLHKTHTHAKHSPQHPVLEIINSCKMLSEVMKEETKLGDQNLDRKTTLKRMLNYYCVKVRTRLFWTKSGSSRRLLWRRQWWVLSSEMWRRRKITDVAEEYTDSVFRVEKWAQQK